MPDPDEPARIQPHGFRIGLSPDWRIVSASANIGEFLSNFWPVPFGQDIALLLGDAAVHTLRNRLSLLRDPHGSARTFALQVNRATRPIDVAMHMVGSDVIIEGQYAIRQESGDPIGLVRALASRLDGKQTREALLAEGARQLRALTGFDGVTIFRWVNGGVAELAAHCARGDVAAAPTPVASTLRLIVDARLGGIAIDPNPTSVPSGRSLLGTATAADRDAMGNAVSLVRIPLIAGGVTWGVTVCLNHTARQVGLERLASAELFGDLLALRIALFEAKS